MLDDIDPIEADRARDNSSGSAVADELSIIASAAASLERLQPAARDRVLDYLVARFQLQRVAARTTSIAVANPAQPNSVASAATDDQAPMDIRSFRELKQPASGQEMAAILAFYLSEHVREDERRAGISPSDVEKYFKQAGFPLPARSRSVLFNAKTAGYLEEAPTRGEYKLSPVGYNLVKYRLPRGADNASVGKVYRRRSRRNSPQRVEAAPDVNG
jgi:hypothetical protein